jgi:hypothetical protein
MSTESASSARQRPSEMVAGFLSVISIVASIGALFWHPLRLSPLAVILALIATAMASKNSRLPLAAVAIGAVCFVGGMTIAVTTSNPIW